MYSGFSDSLWGATDFFSVMMQRFYFVFAFFRHVIDAKNEVHGVIKKSQLAFMSTIDLYVCLVTFYYILYLYLFLVQKYPCKNIDI